MTLRFSHRMATVLVLTFIIQLIVKDRLIYSIFYPPYSKKGLVEMAFASGQSLGNLLF